MFNFNKYKKMKIYKFRQHQIDDDQQTEIDTMVKQWDKMTHFDRQSFIDSINVYTNPEWQDIRAGKFTASTAHQFLSCSKTGNGKLGDLAKKLCYKVMAEKTGWRQAQNPYMEYANIRRGLIFESIARELVQKELGEIITECGFVTGDDELFGCSPDGLIVKEGKIEAIIEIKCPNPVSFYEQLMNCAKPEYQAQMQFQLNICDCPRGYFVIYCPEVSEKVFVLKYTRGIQWQKKIEDRKVQVKQFMNKVQKQIESGEFDIPVTT